MEAPPMRKAQFWRYGSPKHYLEDEKDICAVEVQAIDRGDAGMLFALGARRPAVVCWLEGRRPRAGPVGYYLITNKRGGVSHGNRRSRVYQFQQT